MIRITVLKNAGNEPIGFCTEGHAGYGREGTDIICSAVSVLEQNLANSVSELTGAHFHCEKEKGIFRFQLIEPKNKNAVLLLKSCLLGFQAIEEEYGGKYILLEDQEV